MASLPFVLLGGFAGIIWQATRAAAKQEAAQTAEQAPANQARV